MAIWNGMLHACARLRNNATLLVTFASINVTFAFLPRICLSFLVKGARKAHTHRSNGHFNGLFSDVQSQCLQWEDSTMPRCTAVCIILGFIHHLEFPILFQVFCRFRHSLPSLHKRHGSLSAPRTWSLPAHQP